MAVTCNSWLRAMRTALPQQYWPQEGLVVEMEGDTAVRRGRLFLAAPSQASPVVLTDSDASTSDA